MSIFKENLTEKQQEILRYIKKNSFTRIPTYAKIAENCGLSVKGAWDNVKILKKKGALK